MSIYKVHIVLALALVAASCKAPTASNDQSGNGPPTASKVWVVSTLAGTGAAGFADTGPNTSAQFNDPRGVAVDSRNGNVYVGDYFNHRIRKVVTAEDGTVTVSTLAGTGAAGHADTDPNPPAQFRYPSGVAVDSSGNVYVADTINNRIRKITAAGVVSTLAGDGSTAQFFFPTGVAVDSSGNVYVADVRNHCIQKVTEDGTMSTLAGTGTAGFADGAGSSALFTGPRGVAVDSSGNVYVADTYNGRIRKVVTAEDGTVTVSTLGDRDSPAQFNKPHGVAVDSSGNVYVADTNNHRIRKVVTAEDGTATVSTLAGSGTAGFADGVDSSAQFNKPKGVAVDSSDIVYVADEDNHRIRKIEYKLP